MPGPSTEVSRLGMEGASSLFVAPVARKLFQLEYCLSGPHPFQQLGKETLEANPRKRMHSGCNLLLVHVLFLSPVFCPRHVGPLEQRPELAQPYLKIYRGIR